MGTTPSALPRIAFRHRKGGTGKTSLAIGRAVRLAGGSAPDTHPERHSPARGARVLLLDADPQATASAWGERFADRFGIAVRADSGFALWRDLVLCGWQTVRLRPDAPGARRVLGAPNPRAMRDPHGRLEAFQPNDMNLRWGPVRLVNSRPLMPIEDALAICLRHPDAPASAKSSRLTTAHTPVRRRART
jgi:hypothetical protein